MWQGFPVLVVGTTDQNRKFHLIGLAVTQYEQAEDYAFLFESAKTCAKTLTGLEVNRTALVCDAAKAIHNGFRRVFGGDPTIVMCWQHMLKNVQAKVKKLVKDKSDQVEIVGDICFMQSMGSSSDFFKARSLFLKKWTSEIEFVENFKAEWITQNPN